MIFRSVPSTACSRYYGLNITGAEGTLYGVLAFEYICRYFNVNAGVPLILFNCVTYGEIKGREYPIENFKCYYRSDRFKFYIDQVRKDKFEK